MNIIICLIWHILNFWNKISRNETNKIFKEFIQFRVIGQGASKCTGEELLLILLVTRTSLHGVTDAFWFACGTFVCRKAYTKGQILLVSVPENVSNTPFFLKVTKQKTGLSLPTKPLKVILKK